MVDGYVLVDGVTVSILILMDTAREDMLHSGQPCSDRCFNPHSNGYRSGRPFLNMIYYCKVRVSILILMDTAREVDPASGTFRASVSFNPHSNGYRSGRFSTLCMSVEILAFQSSF